ncbi:hypothetical protein Palpr_0748 [Paludibacter propionicigenes WB4]|uniref:DUF3347 domain-containing protein n=1 Tax=Paludibacter propionicigenes (strain DSM 17365 / JCM 13257 / WB4) TaxID=694427 RepID=E4T2G0_PALPW|nr:hypothetical protein [Paludibacter propionicigenes]ADQ78904.1 hypothetical protein Palpr_0748 [Paludibacter propionicigenes WB4]
MKKILMLVLVLVATSASTFALNPKDYSVFYSLNNKSTFSGIVKYLEADKEQADFLKQIFDETTKELDNATKSNNEKLAESVMKYNLYNAKCVLSQDQYERYLKMLNTFSYNEKSVLVAQK